MRLFLNIWNCLGRPTEGVAYDCYRSARKTYRRTCRHAVDNNTKKQCKLLTELHQAKRPGQFWNIIRKSRASRTDLTAIDIGQLRSHFRDKFKCPHYDQDLINESQTFVTYRAASLKDVIMRSKIVSERRVIRLIRKLRTGCAAGIDGVQAEHLRYATDTSLPLFLSCMLTIGVQFGFLPESFSAGMLIPILKKPQLDPSSPASYRPITVSTTLSKLFELYVLEECSSHEADPSQYGFVSHRGTNTAITLAHDVSAYLLNRGTPTYSCSLDAEGAFDGLPHPILFRKTASILPDHCWRIMVAWYSSLTVHIKWGSMMSAPVPVERGTRQGGLSSPFLFNVFYEELISSLNSMKCGVTIEGMHFNAHC
eukprot:GHVO01043000.1.p1 GENE.GHVO01043000.1~~GHVO01043000.1.p1  ORF type:complete len:367 (-),score=14.65 GHVO01043000.1:1290-2390(-)